MHLPGLRSFRENLISQIPALQLLMAMGWEYLTPDEALALRGHNPRNVVLQDVLAPWLRDHNAIRTRGQAVPFSEGNLATAMRRLLDAPLEQGLLPANQCIYELLTLGTALPQTIDGDTKSHSLRYIDWVHPERNRYHVTEEYAVEKPGSHETRRPDLVLFVNGIPLVVIECKRPDLSGGHGEKAVQVGISQMLRNQGRDEIPNLFVYSQLLLSISTNDALYATTGTPRAFWNLWREQAHDGRTVAVDDVVLPLINRPPAGDDRRHLYAWREDAYAVRAHFDALGHAGQRLPTDQDRALYSLLRPERLLPLIYGYVLYDGGVKKIARYQQYFAVKSTVDRVAHLNHQGTRTGGVIWHTTGSGKSLTMVMLAKALALHPNIPNPRVVIVTDRINLDDQIWRTFLACGKTVERARSGRHLTEMIRAGNVDIITTVIDKFETTAQRQVGDEDVNVFCLVDESHRSQYGQSHARMLQVFPKACYIGFTGTPLLKAEKSTAARFGGFIHSYSMRQAVEDGAVVPLLYEGRMAELSVDQRAIDSWFERVTRDLSDEQKLDLKRKFSRTEALSQAEKRIRQIAYDLSEHYVANWRGTGFKAQLATSSKAAALIYKRCLDEFGMVRSEVVISAPDTREGHDKVDALEESEVGRFWQRTMERYGSEKAYNREVIADFSRADGVELLIVVDKLLVGFDEPRNVVLYIDKSLREHGLLQAIARVNRLFEGKQFGYIVDYRGVLGELNEAMQTYNALEGYDPSDIEGTISGISSEMALLPQRHSDLWAIFEGVANKRDTEALQVHLAPQDRRDAFYEALTAYTRCLKVALSAASYHTDTPADLRATYKRDLTFFHSLRAAVRQRYAEAIDYSDYEAKVRKLLDQHIDSYEVSTITERVDIFDAERFQQAVADMGTASAQADMIAHHVLQRLQEDMEQDPDRYRRFSRMIEETIEAYRAGRLTELEYLKKVQDALHDLQTGRDSLMPAKLGSYKHAPAYYGVMREPFDQYAEGCDGLDLQDICADTAIRLEAIIEDAKVRDWVNNVDVQNRIKLAMEDHLYSVKGRYDIPLTGGDMDVILDAVIEVAKHRDAL